MLSAIPISNHTFEIIYNVHITLQSTCTSLESCINYRVKSETYLLETVYTKHSNIDSYVRKQ